jgi:hypothetical protein
MRANLDVLASMLLALSFFLRRQIAFTPCAASSLIVAFSICLLPSASFSQAELSQPVNLVLQDGQSVWKDPRGPLTQKAQELGLSAAEVQRIRKVVGYIACPGDVANNGAGADSGTGMLVGNGDMIVTDAHLFIDPNTNSPRPNLFECRFINLADQYAIVSLDFSNAKSNKFYTNSPATAWYNDRAIVRLTHRIPNADPLPFDLDETPLRRGDRLIMISSHQHRLTFSMPQRHISVDIEGKHLEADVNREPIAQGCSVMSYYARTAMASSVVYSDCNDTEGASGSVVLVRKTDGSLVAKALLSQGGDAMADHKPFKVGSGVASSDLSFTLSIGMDANVYEDILAMERAKP